MLRQEIYSHQAYDLFEKDLKKAEEIIRAKFPTLIIPKAINTKLGVEVDLTGEYSATDAEDGDITSKVIVSNDVNFDKAGIYHTTYSVTDSDGNTTVAVREVKVVDMNDTIYLSDIDWKSANNSYGRVSKDISASGNKLRLTNEDGQEVVYEKGIGTHSTSTIIYDLTDKNYGYFTSYVGVDRQMFGTVGSVTFEVWLDGDKVYDSGIITSRGSQKFVEVDLAVAKEMKLVVTDGGNGNGSDHATWGDSKLHYANLESEEINRVELDNLLNEISKMDVAAYTEESWNNLIAVRDKVVESLKDGYNQEEVYSLYSELKEAKEKLEVVANYGELINLVNSTKELKGYLYTADSWNALVTSVSKAENIIEVQDSTSEEIEAMIKELTDLINNLVERADKKELQKVVDYADSIKDISYVGATNHIESRWQNFEIFREEAKNSLINPASTE